MPSSCEVICQDYCSKLQIKIETKVRDEAKRICICCFYHRLNTLLSWTFTNTNHIFHFYRKVLYAFFCSIKIKLLLLYLLHEYFVLKLIRYFHLKVFLQAGKRFSFYMTSNIYISSHMNLAGRIDRNFLVVPMPICELSIGRKLWRFFFCYTGGA
jgi:hypothetical protein